MCGNKDTLVKHNLRMQSYISEAQSGRKSYAIEKQSGRQSYPSETVGGDKVRLWKHNLGRHSYASYTQWEEAELH